MSFFKWVRKHHHGVTVIGMILWAIMLFFITLFLPLQPQEDTKPYSVHVFTIKDQYQFQVAGRYYTIATTHSGGTIYLDGKWHVQQIEVKADEIK